MFHDVFMRKISKSVEIINSSKSPIELNLSNSKNGEMTARIQLKLFVCGK